VERSPDERPCSRCKAEPRVLGQRWGLGCFAAWKRENRPGYSELTEEERRRANARSYANVYVNRGQLIPQPCEGCGDPAVQMHHDDYDKPLEVRWLCIDCHLGEHGGTFRNAADPLPTVNP
jgi:hypothetical protein